MFPEPPTHNWAMHLQASLRCSFQSGGQQMKHGYPVQRNLLRTAQQSWKLLSTIPHRESLISCRRRRSASRCRHRLPTVVPEESRSTLGSHCQLTIVIIPTSPRETLKLSDQLTELTKTPESSMVLRESSAGVPKFTMPTSKPPVRVTKATDTPHLTLT